MLTLMLGNIVQAAFWALIYMALGAFEDFEDFETALYFSGLTFTSLGYGDVVINGRVRLIAPLQAANGLMMFGITTGLFIAAFQHAVKKWIEAHQHSVGRAH
jgi:Ion channel